MQKRQHDDQSGLDKTLDKSSDRSQGFIPWPLHPRALKPVSERMVQVAPTRKRAARAPAIIQNPRGKGQESQVRVLAAKFDSQVDESHIDSLVSDLLVDDPLVDDPLKTKIENGECLASEPNAIDEFLRDVAGQSVETPGESLASSADVLVQSESATRPANSTRPDNIPVRESDLPVLSEIIRTEGGEDSVPEAAPCPEIATMPPAKASSLVKIPRASERKLTVPLASSTQQDILQSHFARVIDSWVHGRGSMAHLKTLRIPVGEARTGYLVSPEIVSAWEAELKKGGYSVIRVNVFIEIEVPKT